MLNFQGLKHKVKYESKKKDIGLHEYLKHEYKKLI